MTWIKFCGTTNVEDAVLAWESGADAIGFVYVDHSQRRVGVEQVRAIVDQLARPVERIGVVENVPVGELVTLFQTSGLSGLQLHGHESAAYVREVRARLPKARLIKAIQVESAAALIENVQNYQDCGADNLLLDSYVPGESGGTGTSFDWRAAAKALATSKLPLIVAGGLRSENVAEAIRVFHPFGVDVVSGVERVRGKKDPERLRTFVLAVRAASEIPKEFV